MPNYIYNKLILEGNWNYIKQIIGSDRKNPIKYKQSKAKSYKKFKFDLIAPVDLNLNYDKTSNPYYPYVEAWGTKSQPWNVKIIKEPNKVILKFETAWDPPVNWIKKLELYPIKFNLYWADEDFPRCGSIITNPIEQNPAIITNFEYNSDEAVLFVKKHFFNLYSKHISSYNSGMMLKKINQELDNLINNKYKEKIKLECIYYDNKDNPHKYKFIGIENIPNENIIKESFEIVKKVFNSNNIEINISDNFDIIVKI
jgi:hypothetical protein